MPDIEKLIKPDIKNSLGLYRLRNVQLDSTAEGSKVLFDIDILSTAASGWDLARKIDKVAKLRKNEYVKKSVCCINGGINVNEVLKGYGRIVQHFYGKDPKTEWSVNKIKYMDWIYEGYIDGGYNKFNGIGRLGINAENPDLAVGYWSGFKRIDKGIVHAGQYIYEGTWTSKEEFNSLPANKHRITDLTSK